MIINISGSLICIHLGASPVRDTLVSGYRILGVHLLVYNAIIRNQICSMCAQYVLMIESLSH